MCGFAGMHKAVVPMIPVIGFVYRDKCARFKKLNDLNPEKAHLYY
jgi:hypothetical protein